MFPPDQAMNWTAHITPLPPSEHHFGHKPAFPFNEADWVGFVCTAIGLMICAGGGIGGGGLLVPIYIFLMNFGPKQAIVSSWCSCFVVCFVPTQLVFVSD